MPEHITSVRTYVVVFAALMVFTVVTVTVAFQNLGVLNDVAALTIAVMKTTLVVLYFMHIRHSSALSKLVVAAGFLWLIILIAFTMSDYLTRGLVRIAG